jgi:4-amino-4-deoxy-L-arabinose transferase-like glycosyltransferase
LVFKNLELSGGLVSVVFGSLLIIPVYLLACSLWDRKVAALASLLTVFYPGLVNISTELASDSVYSFFLVTMAFTFWQFLNRQRNSWLYAVLTGAMLSLCYLTRAIGFFYFCIIFFWCLILWFTKKITYKRLISGTVLIAITFALFASPYLFFIRRHIGSFSLSPAASSWLKISLATTENELEIAKTQAPKQDSSAVKERIGVAGYFISYPRVFAAKFARNTFLLYKRKFPDEVPPLVFILVSLGLFGLPFSKQRSLKHAFLLSMLFPVFVQTIWAPESRYIMPLLPFLIIIAASGLLCLNEVFLSSAQIKKAHKKIIFAVITAGLILSFLPSVLKVVSSGRDEPIEHKKAGLWLKQFDVSNPVIMSRKPWVSFYADGDWVCLPYGDIDEVIGYAQEKKVKYLVIDELLITRLRPQLAFLLDENNAPKVLKLIYKDESLGRKILIYEIITQKR